MKSKGIEGEDLARDYLVTEGYEMLERNYRHKRGEIDIIAKCEEVVCFVEVKLRSNADFGEPEDFVSQRQKETILTVADHYTYEKEWEGDIRFDIVAIKKIDGVIEIKHFQDAFY